MINQTKLTSLHLCIVQTKSDYLPLTGQIRFLQYVNNTRLLDFCVNWPHVEESELMSRVLHLVRRFIQPHLWSYSFSHYPRFMLEHRLFWSFDILESRICTPSHSILDSDTSARPLEVGREWGGSSTLFQPGTLRGSFPPGSFTKVWRNWRSFFNEACGTGLGSWGLIPSATSVLKHGSAVEMEPSSPSHS